MSIKTLDQQRALYAWECVKRQERSDEYKNLAKTLPALIMTNGLMQSLAFLEGKGKSHHIDLMRDVYCWAILGKREYSNVDQEECKLEDIFELSSEKYQRATEEALEILQWIRQMADAVIGKKG